MDQSSALWMGQFHYPCDVLAVEKQILLVCVGEEVLCFWKNKKSAPSVYIGQ